MIRKFATIVLLTASCFIISCSDTKKSSKDKEDETEEKKGGKEKISEDETDDSNSDINKAATGYCDCFNEVMGDIDPKLKKMIIRASKSSNPTKVLQDDVKSIDDKEEQQRLAQEMQRFGDMDGADACTKKVAKKYALNENDKKVQKQILNALEENGDCEVVAALMRIGLSQGSNTDKTTDEE